jgi:hypothetical protein
VPDFAQGFAILTWVRLFPQLNQSGQKAFGMKTMGSNNIATAPAKEQLEVGA